MLLKKSFCAILIIIIFLSSVTILPAFSARQDTNGGQNGGGQNGGGQNNEPGGRVGDKLGDVSGGNPGDIPGGNTGDEPDGNQPPFASFRDIPGITENDIAAVEAILERYDHFIYGMPLGAESFTDENGEVSGFAARICEWLGELFGLRFIPQIYELPDLQNGLKNGGIDFTSYINFTASAGDRREEYLYDNPAAAGDRVRYHIGDYPSVAEVHNRLFFDAYPASAEEHSGSLPDVSLASSGERSNSLPDVSPASSGERRGSLPDVNPASAEEHNGSLPDVNHASLNERSGSFYKTSPIAYRPIAYMRIAGSPPLSEIKAARLPRYALVDGEAAADALMRYAANTPPHDAAADATADALPRETTDVAADTPPHDAAVSKAEFEPIYVSSHGEAYALLVSGEADAVPCSGISEIEYLEYRDVVMEHTFPWVYFLVTVATQNPDFEPIINAIQLAIDADADHYAGGLYKQGYKDYQKHMLNTRLTDVERDFIKNNPVIKIGAQYYNYPIDFYNTHVNEWQGIIFDVLAEVSALTGLSFRVATDTYIEWPDLLQLLEAGEVSLIPELTEIPERKGRYLWQDTTVMRGQYVLISLSDYPRINTDDIFDINIGLMDGYASTAVFEEMFPDHAHTRSYRNFNEAVAALERGETDAIMCSKIQLLTLTNYEERVGFKINFIFDRAYDIKPGFNKDETILLSIMDIALRHINVGKISDYWQYKTYDYQSILLGRQRVLIAAAAVSLFFVLMIILYLYLRSRRKSKVISEQAAKITAAHFSLVEANMLTEILLESSPVCVQLWDSDLNMTDCNDAAVKLYGYEDKKDLIAGFIGECMPEFQPDGRHSGEAAAEYLKKAFYEGRCAFGFMFRIPGSGEPMPAEVALIRILHMDRYLVAEYTRDLREQIAANESMRKAEIAEERSRAKSDFLASMSHEIRTPMNAILGMSEILMREGLNARQTHYAKDINVSVKSLLTIINDILDFSKLQTGKFKLVPIHYRFDVFIDNIMSIARFLIEDKDINLEVEIQEGFPVCLFGDDVRLRQVLMNLLGNAIKFTEAGFVRLSAKRIGGDINITVSDSGIGIPEDKIQSLFEAFEQADLEKNRNKTGTGLGLAISKTIVEMMGGHIEAESVYGEGSSFHIVIPYVPGDEALTAEKSETETEIFAPEAKILIVDDKQINLNVAAGLLELMQISADTALSGGLAIEMISRTQYDLVFMDYMMPDMNGVETTKAIRAMGVSLPIVALTANILDEAKEVMAEAGIDDFLSKPIVHAELTNILLKWLPAEKCRKSPGETSGHAAAAQNNSATAQSSPAAAQSSPAAADAAPNNSAAPAAETDAFWDRVNQIRGLDVSDGLGRIRGQRSVYESTLKLLVRENEKSIRNMLDFLAAGDIVNFRIEAHGLKGALANVGATELSGMAYELEKAAAGNDSDFCEKALPAVIDRLTEMNCQINDAFAMRAAKCAEKVEPNAESVERDVEIGAGNVGEIVGNTAILSELESIFQRMTEAFKEIDLMRLDEEMEHIDELEISAALSDEIEQIKEAVMMMDYDKAVTRMQTILASGT